MQKKSSTKKVGFTEKDNRIHALVVAELSSKQLEPLSSCEPECLVKIANVPILVLTLSRLISDGFNEILIFACQHYTAIKEFVAKLKLEHREISANISVVNGCGAESMGDVMRELDSSQLTRGFDDFLIVPADLVCDFSLKQCFEQHTQRRSASPTSVLTFVYPEMCPADSQIQGDRVSLVVNCTDQKIMYLSRNNPMALLQNETVVAALQKRKFALLPSIRDVEITVCSSHIPPLFQENFDFVSMDDVLNGILTNEDVIGFTCHLSMLPQGKLVQRACIDLTQLMNFTWKMLRREGLASHFLNPIRFTEMSGLFNNAPPTSTVPGLSKSLILTPPLKEASTTDGEKIDPISTPKSGQQKITSTSASGGGNESKSATLKRRKSKAKNKSPRGTDNAPKTTADGPPVNIGNISHQVKKQSCDAVTYGAHHLLALSNSVYIDSSAQVARSARLIGACYIGPNCSVAADTILIDCVLQKDCCVGVSCRLRRVIADSNVQVGNHVEADFAWLSKDAKLLDNVHLGRKCFIGQPHSLLKQSSSMSADDSAASIEENLAVCLGPNAKLPKRSVIVAPSTGDIIMLPKVGGTRVWAVDYANVKKTNRLHGQSESTSGGRQRTTSFGEVSVESSDDEDEEDATLAFIENAQLGMWSTHYERIAYQLARNHGPIEHLSRRMSVCMLEADDSHSKIGSSSRARSNSGMSRDSTASKRKPSKSGSKKASTSLDDKDEAAGDKCSTSKKAAEADEHGDESEDEVEMSEVFLVAELQSTLERGIRKHHSVDSTVLEVNSLKHAYNVPIDDLYFLLAKALIKTALTEAKSSTKGKSEEEKDEKPSRDEIVAIVGVFKRLLGETEASSLWRSVLANYCKPLSAKPAVAVSKLTADDDDEADAFDFNVSSAETAERCYLQALEDTACHESRLVMASSAHLLHALYSADLVSEESVFWWVKNSPLLLDDEVAKETAALRSNMKPFLDWLQEAEEESNEED